MNCFVTVLALPHSIPPGDDSECRWFHGLIERASKSYDQSNIRSQLSGFLRHSPRHRMQVFDL